MDRVQRINIQWPKALAVIGTARLIAYDTTHGRKRKSAGYEHEFHPGTRALVCAGRQKGILLIISPGARFKANAHGIVDLDRFGARVQWTPTLTVARRTRSRT